VAGQRSVRLRRRCARLGPRSVFPTRGRTGATRSSAYGQRHGPSCLAGSSPDPTPGLPSGSTTYCCPLCAKLAQAAPSSTSLRERRSRPRRRWPTAAPPKAALNAYGKALAAELAPAGIRVTTIMPGNVLTPGGDAILQNIADAMGFSLADITAAIPLGRLGDHATSPKPSPTWHQTGPNGSPERPSPSRAANCTSSSPGSINRLHGRAPGRATTASRRHRA
jgi:hypothetical protein